MSETHAAGILQWPSEPFCLLLHCYLGSRVGSPSYSYAMTGKGGSSYDTKKKLELDPSTSEELEKLAKEVISQSRDVVAKMKRCWQNDLIVNPETAPRSHAVTLWSAVFKNAKSG